jgi:hypothetical protein
MRKEIGGAVCLREQQSSFICDVVVNNENGAMTVQPEEGNDI